MGYPISKRIKVQSAFNDQEIDLVFNSGLTIFVGPNGSGKTQTLRMLKSYFSDIFESGQIRYLSSNRIGLLEQYRSKASQHYYNANDCSLGDIGAKSVKQQIEVAAGDFFTMDDQKDVYIKVSERLSTLFNREMFLRWDSGNLKVYFSKSGSSEEYSIVAEASGLINVISILAALYDNDIKMLLIDEPEVSLHPQLQAFLLKEINKTAGDYEVVGKKMIIMSTHSTEMMDINNITNLTNYVFFGDNGLPPQQILPSSEELKNKKLIDLISRIGQSHKTAFFSKSPILVEGVSDSLMCKYLDNKFELNLGIAGAQIVPVEGKGQFPATVKLMRIIGKEPIIIADLDAFIDDNDVINLYANRKESTGLALSLGHSDISEFVRKIKTDIGEMCKENKDSLLDKYQDHPYWKHRGDTDEEKARKRAIVATIFNCSDVEILNWPNGDKWDALKKRITVLLNCLEQVGCFILRKGALESYYTHSSKDTFDGKPSAVIEEIESLSSKPSDFIKTTYNDILRALIFAGKTKIIDETSAIKRELLSELAPILGMISMDTKPEQINTVIRQSKGTDKSLFQYTLINAEDIPAIKVDLKSKIMQASGFPFSIKKGENVNIVVDNNVKSRP